MKPLSRFAPILLATLLTATAARAEDGYELWLRYRPLPAEAGPTSGRSRITELVMSTGTPTQRAARDEMVRGLRGMLGVEVPLVDTVTRDGALVAGTPSWKKAIERAIKNARAVVVFLSPYSADSEWVERELDYARAQDVPIFPVIVRGSKKDAVPLSLINAQWVSLSSDDKYTSELPKLIAALQQEVKS